MTSEVDCFAVGDSKFAVSSVRLFGREV